jgi:hypothetical protein
MGEAASAKWRIFRSFWLTSENPVKLDFSQLETGRVRSSPISAKRGDL